MSVAHLLDTCTVSAARLTELGLGEHVEGLSVS